MARDDGEGAARRTAQSRADGGRNDAGPRATRAGGARRHDPARHREARGGATLAAFAALGTAGAGSRLMAQEATPAADQPTAGRYVVVRIRTLRPEIDPEELIDLIRDGFLPPMRALPGFVSYLAVANPETGDRFSVGVFVDKAGADEPDLIAAAWGRSSGAAPLTEGDPVVAEGTFAIAAP